MEAGQNELAACLEELIQEVRDVDPKEMDLPSVMKEKAFFITYLLPVVFAIAVLMSGLSGMQYNHSYELELYCPVMNRLRALSSMDAVAYFYLKPHVAELCDDEDSLWRLFSDTWVRAVVTSTDTWYLLMFEVKSCALALGLCLLLTPLVSFVYTALVGYPIYMLERKVGCPWWVDMVMYIVCLFVAGVLTLFTVMCRSSPVGVGIRGARVSMNALDKDCYDFRGVLERERRVMGANKPASFWFIMKRTTRALESCIITAVVFVIVLRFALLWSEVRLSEHLPFETLAAHQASLSALTAPHFSLFLQGFASILLPQDTLSPPLTCVLALSACIFIDYVSSQSSIAEGTNAERRRADLVTRAAILANRLKATDTAK